MRLEEHRKPLCIVYSNGYIFWMPQAIYRSSCNIDVYAFPFDVQNCYLKFGSWTYDGFKMNVDFYKDKNFIDLTEYVESNAWTIIDVPAERNVKNYSCCPAPYIDLQYHLVFQRKATLYNYILILPCILLTSITLILFWIPPESPAKMQLDSEHRPTPACVRDSGLGPCSVVHTGSKFNVHGVNICLMSRQSGR
ncbi:hypothetical protein ACOMHN_041871 [Nucella lapillus]